MDLALAIAQGFHNAPRLYGDSTVRTPTRVSGIQSGLRAAGEEFIFGVYDGVTGLVRQPYHGAKERGALGFAQGLGKGVGGFVLKDLAAITGPIGYTLKGVHKEFSKRKQPTTFIRQARIIQGARDARALDPQARRELAEKVVAVWKTATAIWNEVNRTQREGVMAKFSEARKRRRDERLGRK